ncbi:hypothetical protein CDD82_4792 [Ophiocordyceps australis]|uniref:RING-type domain-containing protein n=1 Tax=Ophiocordyceps australis TaxID=1399860 RepID=A0A2C5Z4X7_9HYPO|nr:hypothetical protein CDD82_4792 [Ophiocordyceps australis]
MADDAYISDEAQLGAVAEARPDLRELNANLDALAAVFPDVQIEVFRELLGKFDGESRLALVANAMLKSRVEWVKGRWRTTAADGQDNDEQSEGVPIDQRFRSDEYRRAVRRLAWSEFRGLSRSTINAVLAENNYSYLEARPTLVALSAKSWRFAIHSVFSRRAKPAAAQAGQHHPLIVWRSSGKGCIVPALRATGSPELDRDLFDALVRPVQTQLVQEREQADAQLAAEMNMSEAEAAEALLECACCFSSMPFECTTSCARCGQLVCFDCVQRAVREALFGQGWSSIDVHRGSLRCLALEADECDGFVPAEQMRRAIDDPDLTARLDERLAEQCLAACQQSFIRCPFCPYAEIDDIWTPAHHKPPALRPDKAYRLVLLALGLAGLVAALPLALMLALAAVVFFTRHLVSQFASAHYHAALGRHARRRRGPRFTCLNPACRRASCLSCLKAWTDPHTCHESSLVALRTQVEQAMSLAIKRVCPRCNTSFVKTAGCNKLTCPCGYKMCYVCRADLSVVGYRHFCDHFRPDGDASACAECDKCNLWQNEDVDRVLCQAREDAEQRWREALRDENADLGARLGMPVAPFGVRGLGERVLAGSVPAFADVVDVLVDGLYT